MDRPERGHIKSVVSGFCEKMRLQSSPISSIAGKAQHAKFMYDVMCLAHGHFLFYKCQAVTIAYAHMDT
eukprot:6094581-Karenia_brevis.AAC.1